MDKINIDKVKLESSNIADENFEKLASLFPNVVTETIVNDRVERAIDIEKLKQEINAHILSENEERYNFSWPDKRKSVVLANAPTRNTLRACIKESKDFDNTENLYIEGDNLEVLKLLRNTYLGQVKMIYIDPPYNTGKDFVYKDNFFIDKEDYLENSGQFDEEGNRLFENTEANGRFHTDWLNMMYPRLKMARDLLTDDGAIFISIDDNEVSNLRKICDEIFGERNFVAEIVWTNKEGGGSSDSKHFRVKHEYIISYARNVDNLKIIGLPVEDIDRYREQDKYVETRGKYQLIKLNSASIQYSESLDYPILSPDKTEIFPSYSDKKACWRWSREKVEWGIRNDFIVIKKDKNNEWAVYTKQYLNCDNEGNIIARTIQPIAVIDKFSTTQSNKALNEILEKNSFSYAKPIDLIKFLLQISKTDNDIILDFFSGSATTAHAVMQLNAEDGGGNRKFIMVQLPAETPEKSEARKAGYSTICEIGKERIRIAGEKIKKDYPNANIDTGFRVFKLDSSNMEDVYYKAEDLSQNDIRKTIINIKADRSNEDLLFQIILSFGIKLTCNIEVKKVNNRDVYFVDNTYLLVCFENHIDDKTIEELAKMKPEIMVFNQNTSDSTLINIEQIFKQISPTTIMNLI